MTALLGLLLPSVSLTILITAYYARIQRVAVVQAAVRGVLPATVGLGLLTALGMARGLLEEIGREGRGGVLIGMALLIGSGLAASLGHWPVVLVLLAGGVLGAVASVAQHRGRRAGEAENSMEQQEASPE